MMRSIRIAGWSEKDDCNCRFSGGAPMKKYLLAGTAVLLLSPAANAHELKPVEKKDKSPIHFSIRLEKKSYRPGEIVELLFRLENRSTGTLYVADGFLAPGYHEVGPARHLELLASDEDKTQFRFWSDLATEGEASGARRVFRLEPGKSYSGSVTISAGSFETISKRKKHSLGKDSKTYTPALKYEVNEHFYVHEPPKGFDKKLLWKGTLNSNEVVLRFE